MNINSMATVLRNQLQNEKEKLLFEMQRLKGIDSFVAGRNKPKLEGTTKLIFDTQASVGDIGAMLISSQDKSIEGLGSVIANISKTFDECFTQIFPNESALI